MKTIIDIPEDLILEAMKVTGAITKTEAVIRALEHVIQQYKDEKLENCRDKAELDTHFAVLKKRKSKKGLMK